jgi:hypothetical protein
MPIADTLSLRDVFFDLTINVLGDEGHYAAAEKLFRETLDIRRRVLGIR